MSNAVYCAVILIAVMSASAEVMVTACLVDFLPMPAQGTRLKGTILADCGAFDFEPEWLERFSSFFHF